MTRRQRTQKNRVIRALGAVFEKIIKGVASFLSAQSDFYAVCAYLPANDAMQARMRRQHQEFEIQYMLN